MEARVVLYPEAFHDFDAAEAPHFARNLVTGRHCDGQNDLDHFTVTLRASGEDVTARAGAYYRGRLERGATIGGDATARRQAPEDVAAFVKRHFKL